MNYQHLPPPSSLKGYVQYFWVLESPTVPSSSTIFRPIPDGCPGLLFQQEQSGKFFDQSKKELPALFLYGQTVHHRELHTSGPLKTVGICFYPHVLHSVFGLDANELTDTCVDINLLLRVQEKSLIEQLNEAPRTTSQITLLSDYLLKKIRHNNRDRDVTTDYALTTFFTSQGNVSLKELQELLNVSERSLERNFKQRVGISPRLFARICRFQASLRQLRNSSHHKLSDIAFDNGYADQSHFIRAFKEFTGLSPYQYQKQTNELIENLVEWTQ
jgi:AraC-like DNA-binding protein